LNRKSGAAATSRQVVVEPKSRRREPDLRTTGLREAMPLTAASNAARIQIHGLPYLRGV
jgi:hypothetical protein